MQLTGDLYEGRVHKAVCTFCVHVDKLTLADSQTRYAVLDTQDVFFRKSLIDQSPLDDFGYTDPYLRTATRSWSVRGDKENAYAILNAKNDVYRLVYIQRALQPRAFLPIVQDGWAAMPWLLTCMRGYPSTPLIPHMICTVPGYILNFIRIICQSARGITPLSMRGVYDQYIQISHRVCDENIPADLILDILDYVSFMVYLYGDLTIIRHQGGKLVKEIEPLYLDLLLALSDADW